MMYGLEVASSHLFVSIYLLKSSISFSSIICDLEEESFMG